MTGYTVHTGASKKFVNGWDRIFSANSGEGENQTESRSNAGRSKKSSAGKTETTRKSAKPTGRKSL